MKFDQLIAPTHLDLQREPLEEVRMGQRDLNQFINSPEAETMLMGFEAELIYQGRGGEAEVDYSDVERDYDVDYEPSGIGDIGEFFSGDSSSASYDQREQAQGQNSGRVIERLVNSMTEDYRAAVRENIAEHWDDELSDEDILTIVAQYIKRQYDFDLFLETYIEREFDGEHSPEAVSEARDAWRDMIYDEAANSVADIDDTYSAARKKWEEDQLGEWEYSEETWLRDIGLDSMSDVYNSNRYGRNLDWPYHTEPQYNPGNEYDQSEAEELASSLKRRLRTFWDDYEVNRRQQNFPEFPSDFPYSVRASYGYHGEERRPHRWIFEPDGSLDADEGDMPAELISPPMPLPEGIQTLRTVLEWARDDESAYSNSSTGLHIGLSVPDQSERRIDYVKLVLFIGDQDILEKFDRASIHFCESSLGKIRNDLKRNVSAEQITQALAQMRRGLSDIARETLKFTGHGKYSSVHVKDDYIEFRSMGGYDYLSDAKINDVINTVQRFAYSLWLASDPNRERRDYMSKLYDLIQGKKMKYYDPLDPANLKQPTKFTSDRARGLRAVPDLDSATDPIRSFVEFMITGDRAELQTSLAAIQQTRARAAAQGVTDTQTTAPEPDATDTTAPDYYPLGDDEGEYGLYRRNETDPTRIRWRFNAADLAQAQRYGRAYADRHTGNPEAYEVRPVPGSQTSFLNRNT